MTTAQRLMKWASEIHLARQVVEGLRKQMADLRCQYELAEEIIHDARRERPLLDRDGLPYSFLPDDECKPCWKGTYEDCGDSWGRKEFSPYGDRRESGWCDPCKKREKLREPYATAKKHLGTLNGTLWRLATKAHAEVEAELDEAGQ